MHADVGYAQRATAAPHRAVTLDAMAGFGLGDRESGVGGSLNGRLRVGDEIASAAMGPGGFLLVSAHERVEVVGELAVLGGLQSVGSAIGPVLLPTLRGGVALALEDPRATGFEPTKRLFVLAMTDYSIHIAPGLVSAPSFGLSLGYGFAGHL